MELNTSQAHEWIAARLGVRPEDLRTAALGGGVSNHVVLAESGGMRWVFKQSLEKLRVAQEWRSRRDRIWVECAALRAMAGVLPAGSVPRVLLEEREEHVFAMEAAPEGCMPWKTALLAGEVRREIAVWAGSLQGTWIRESARHPEWAQAFGDLTVFGELRVDPYYRSTAARYPELAERFASLIRECAQRRISLVHGDFSPKNLLAGGGAMMVIDWEVAHWGDPAFDGGFLTNHLLLKALRRPAAWTEYEGAAGAFWEAARAEAGAGYDWLEGAAMRHLGCLLLARVDGKSPVEYIEEDAMKEKIRGVARGLITSPAKTHREAFERAAA
ncbi:MAG: phosphotransferase [Candidatus Solibacter usitatus]|nr:phosphotransferase [Candidatus Solibacter usitatus]